MQESNNSRIVFKLSNIVKRVNNRNRKNGLIKR